MRGAGVGAGEPVGEVKELADSGNGVGGAKGFGAVGGEVAEVFDDAGLGVNAFADEVAECGVVDEGVEVVLIGHAQRGA